MDEDLNQMTREELIEQVRQLRQGIRQHRDSSLHELCWHQPALWGLLPEKSDPVPVVPEWAEFMQGCVHYRQSLDEQARDAPRSKHGYEPAGKSGHRRADAPRQPRDWPLCFTQRLKEADLEGLVQLYESEANFLSPARETIVGRDRIRSVLAELIDRKIHFKSRVHQTAAVDDIAMLYTDFMLQPGSSGEYRKTSKAIEVLRRQPDGTWKLLIGDPAGRNPDVQMRDHR